MSSNDRRVDAASALKWSMDNLMKDNVIWLYPVGLSFVNAILLLMLARPNEFSITIVFLLSLIVSIAIFIFMLISAKMFVQIYKDGSLNFESAKNEVMSNIGSYLLVGILGLVISILVITVPITLLLIVYSVFYPPNEIGKNLDRSIKMLTNNFSNVALLAILAIVSGLLMALTRGLIDLIIDPLATFINILVLGGFTYLVAESEHIGDTKDMEGFSEQ